MGGGHTTGPQEEAWLAQRGRAVPGGRGPARKVSRVNPPRRLQKRQVWKGQGPGPSGGSELSAASKPRCQRGLGGGKGCLVPGEGGRRNFLQPGRG